MSLSLVSRPGPRRWFPAGLILLALGAGSLAAAQGQDLASLARKERERRAKITKKAKVLTEDDGKAAAESGAGALTVAGAETATAPAAAEGSGGARDAAAAQQAAWRTRAESVRKAVEAAEAKVQATENEIKAVAADLAPLSAADAQDPMRLQKKDQKIAQLNKQLVDQKNAVAEAKKALAAFEEEARANGVPPGWLR